MKRSELKMPKITARVVNPFKENAHKGHLYVAGDIYPADGFEADEERVYFLTGLHPKYEKIYLADISIHGDEIQNPVNTQDPPVVNEGYPKSTGGGWYSLSNGEKVQGKDEAIEAQNELNRGE